MSEATHVTHPEGSIAPDIAADVAGAATAAVRSTEEQGRARGLDDDRASNTDSPVVVGTSSQ